MDGLIIKYEWLSHDFIYLKKGYQNAFNRNMPMVFDCSNFTVKYQMPEGSSQYASYIGIIGEREFEFASLNLEKTTKTQADDAIKEFFLSRPANQH